MHQQYKGNLWGSCLWKDSESEKIKHFHHPKGKETVAAFSRDTTPQAFLFLTDAHAPLEKHQNVTPHPGILTKYLEEFPVVCAKRSDNALPYSMELLVQSALKGVLRWQELLTARGNTSGKDSDTQQGGDEDKGYSYRIPQWPTLSLDKSGWCN